MKTLLAFSFLALSACATLTAESEQAITVITEPAGATCKLHNNVGAWEIAQTPGVAEVTRSFSPLSIVCFNQTMQGRAVLEPQTRGRAYGNLLLLGVPAAVDAGTGKGYEYAPDTLQIDLK